MWSFKSTNNKRLPQWVAELPFGGDRQTVKSLVEAGANLNEPREMIFCVYATPSGAARIQEEVKRYSWSCKITPSAAAARGNLSCYVELGLSKYTLNLRNFLDDKTTIKLLAEKYGAEYDGWFASV